MRLTQLLDKTPIEYAEVFPNYALSCDRVYDKYVLKSIFVESWSEWISESMGSCWDFKKNAAVHNLACFATSCTKLQHRVCNTDQRSYNEKRPFDAKILDPEAEMLATLTRIRGLLLNSLARTRHYLNLDPFWQQTEMVVWQQQPQNPQQPVSPPSSVMSIDNAPICRFCLAYNHRMS